MVSIRPMLPDDAGVVRALDSASFSHHARQTGRAWPLPLRTRANFLASLALHPQGCFVAEGDRPVGYAFSRHWGRLGWVGALGVQPELRGYGIGQRLLAAGVAALKAAGCTTIGLETMPDSPYNLGVYCRAGFRPVYPTVILEKEIIRPEAAPRFTVLRCLESEIDAVTRISMAARPGLDYAPEVRNALEFGWGSLLFIGEPEPWGIALVRTEPTHEGAAEPVAPVVFLAISPSARDRVPEALAAIEAFAGERGFQRLRIAAPSADWPTLRALLVLGCQVTRLSPRMHYTGPDGAPPGVDCYRWAM